ncbi:MAG: pyridoxamine 5'-phosphate oxidase family protein [Candidatus Didemnitutus sp.]|nr:pyridoxamine 5'-phosphate oxidase family protein [Candidatus Didemnitutus sp.]
MAHHYLDTVFTSDVRAAQKRFYGREQALPPSPGPDALGPDEAAFIAEADSFYLGSVNTDGWPYVQHRGGPRGFLRVLDPHTLAFADLGGNRQIVSAGNVIANDRVALFIMHYPRRQRLKLLGHASFVPAADAPELSAQLAPPELAPRLVERICRIRVVGFDWNCPKYITPRFTAAEVEEALAPLRERVAALESALQDAGLPPPV